MTASNKQISLAIIILFFIGVLIYFFLWFGYVEIFFNHSEIDYFQVKSREKIYQCDKNPCRLKIRAGQKFTAQVDNELAKNKNIIIQSIPLFKTEKIIIQAKEELPEAQIQEISRDFASPVWPYEIKNNFGPIIVSENRKFAIFARKNSTGIDVFINNGSSNQILASIEDIFSSIFLENNFSLNDNGIVIPAKNRVYFFDLSTQRKSKLLEMNSLRMSDITVSVTGEEVVFYNLKEESWQKHSITEKKYSNYSANTNFAGFWKDSELKIIDNKIYLNGKEAWEIPAKISNNDEFLIKGDDLILLQDFKVFKIAII